MDQKDILKRIQAAEKLLWDTKINKAKFDALRTLIRGFNPKIDKVLSLCAKKMDKIEKIKSGAVIELSVEGLSENTPEQKKRKKALLLFLHYWKNLKSEVERVQTELVHAKQQGDSQADQVSSWGRIIGYAKGPLGVVTLIAVAAVALKFLAVTIVVKNVGCDSLQLSSFSLPLPGIEIPQDQIPSGGSAVIKLPPLNFKVDGTDSGELRLSTFGFGQGFSLGGADVIFNGTSISGRQTTIRLGERREHELMIVCS